MSGQTMRVVIVGAGPAGLAAAIAAAQSGLQVDVFERNDSLVDKPGETLHPGIEPIFETLGIRALANAKTALRFPGILLHTADGECIAQPFGKDADGPWYGYQFLRRELLKVLWKRAVALGAKVHFLRKAERIVVRQNGFADAVRISGEWVSCDWLLDASGAVDWLSRCEGNKLTAHSPPLIARYGYSPSHPTGNWPSRKMNGKGWNWHAPLGDGRSAWVDLHIRGQRTALRAEGRGADATWRLAKHPTAPNCLRIGDAACRLDPAAGRGVLRALMSGLAAAQSIKTAGGERLNADRASREFGDWIARWFYSDAQELRRLYRAWWQPEAPFQDKD